MSYVFDSSTEAKDLEENTHTAIQHWKFTDLSATNTIDPYDTKLLQMLMRCSGVRYSSSKDRGFRTTQPSCLYRWWCYIWVVPHVLLVLQGCVLFYFGMCDLLYFLFAFLPLNVLVTRHRYKKWHEDGKGLESLHQPSQNIPLSKKEIHMYDVMFCIVVVNTVFATWLLAVCTLWLPLLWIENATATSLPLWLKVVVQTVDILAWSTGPFTFFAFFNTSFACIGSFYLKYRGLVQKTTALLDQFNKKNYDMKEHASEIATFVNECLPRHMEMARALHKYSSTTSVSLALNVAGVMWLIGMCYTNAFLWNLHSDSAWFSVRPWTTLAFITLAFFTVLMPFALLSSKTIEYIRVTETCLGSIAAHGTSGVLVDAHDNGIAAVARRELMAFTVVRDLCFLRIMGMPIGVETLTKLFYVLAVLFVLPIVTGGG